MIQFEQISETTGDIQHIVLYTVADLSRALDLKNGKKHIGRNGMFRLLLQNHLITKDRQPAQFLIQQGLAVFHGARKAGRIHYMVCLTEKGLNYICNGFRSGRYNSVLEPKKEVGVNDTDLIKKQPALSINDVC